MENNNKKMKLEDFIMLWGFMIFIFGAIGMVQIGILDGLSGFIFIGLLIFLIGLSILILIAIYDKMGKNKFK